MAPLEPPKDTVEDLREPPARYSDFTFYDEDGRRVPDGSTLQMKQSYTLEVAVRVAPSGIPYQGKEDRRPIREPRQKKPVTIWVVADSTDFEIEHPTSTLVLPPTGDSTQNATVSLSPLRVASDGEKSGQIDVSLYYELNLLERAEIRAEVVGPYDDPASSSLDKPIFFSQRKAVRDYLDFDHVRARSMSIEIGKSPGGYDFRFRFRNDAGGDVVLPARVRLKGTDLEDKVAAVRDIWQEIALSDLFVTQLAGTQSSFAEHMSRLARAGRNLWRTLFLQETEGSMAQIGDWLRDHAPERDSILQIHVDPDASDFVFPWTLLYDRELPDKDYQAIDPEGFWGLRYRIEQPPPGRKLATDRPAQAPEPLRVGFMLWDQFRNAKEQIDLMDELVAESGGKLAVSTPPITSARACRELLKAGGHQLLYFYSHGYTRARQDTASNGADFGRFFMDRYDKLAAESPLRESLKPLYDAVSQVESEPRRSFIQLTNGKLYLDELSEIRKLPGEPLVVLNMCESAQRSPLLSESFVHFFLDRGAAAVLGTECPMTVEFAQPFAVVFLNGLLRGDEVGEALLDSRRKFFELRNPLGLAYTLYGRDTLSFEPPCLPELAEAASGAGPSS